MAKMEISLVRIANLGYKFTSSTHRNHLKTNLQVLALIQSRTKIDT